VEVAPGTQLLVAAREAGIKIDSPCGGKGTCGKCIVQVQAGDILSDHLGLMSPSAVNHGYRLACRSQVMHVPVTVFVPEQSGNGGGKFLDETRDTCLVPSERFPRKDQLEPLTRKILLRVAPSQLEDGLSDLDRVTRSLQQILGQVEVSYSLPVIRQIAQALRQAAGIVTVSVVDINAGSTLRVARVEAGDNTARYFGIAVDIGTTTVAVQLVLLPAGEVVATQTAYNEQIACGLDVIGRIHYARQPERLAELRTRVLDTINHLLSQLCQGNDVDPIHIDCAVIAGNTTMIHLLLGLPPEYIRLEPYTPTLLTVPLFQAEAVGIQIYPSAPVYISPAVGSYVGGDITAGLLCTGLATTSDEVNLFLDIGTNGELVIGNNDFLLTCACSAGPAFEGGGIGSGMRAALGAIDLVEIAPETGTATYRVIGDVPPNGICGTGMISLLANLFQTGWLDAAGKLNRVKSCPAIQIEGRQARYIVDTGQEISINEIEIDNIIRAKAAIYAACALMLEQVGMTFEDVTHIYIAGGFGRFLDIEKAIIIGLLPDLPREKYQYIGNSSLTGAYMMLVSQQFREKQKELARRMTYVELSTDPAYMDQFTGACFIPHTDSQRFPSVGVGPRAHPIGE